MDSIQAMLLGFLQGLTEFLPVSSSTHLSTAQKLMGIEPSETTNYFNLICHFGTLTATGVFFRKDIFQILQSPNKMLLFVIALLPLIPAYILLKPVRVALTPYAPLMLLPTAGFLFLASNKQAPQKLEAINRKSALWVGIAQSLALIPGISRSGVTISTARLRGSSWEQAVRFSFLLSIPTIFGGSAIETLQISHHVSTLPLTNYLIGFALSLFTGLFSIRLLFWILKKQQSLKIFAWYCVLFSLFSIFVIGAPQ